MTATPTPSRFNLPTHTITIAELRAGMPKAKRVRCVSIAPIAPPSVELIAELQGLLDQLHPADPHPDRHWKTVTAVIFNETLGHFDGYACASAWIGKAKTYPNQAALKKYWKGLNLKHENPAILRTLQWMVDQKISK